MKELYVVNCCRTAIGSFGGALKNTPAVDLGAIVIKEALNRAGVKPEQVDEVMFGCILTAAQGQNVARQASIKAGIPYSVPAYTVGMVCGSGMKSMIEGARSILAGDADVVVCGGTENMSAAPYAVPTGRYGARMGHTQMIDTMIKDGLWDAYNNYHMGTTAENIADIWGITRKEMDEFAASSQQKTEAAQKAGKFEAEIVPVPVKVKKDIVEFKVDEFPRAGVTAEGISKLKGAFPVGPESPNPQVVHTFEPTGIQETDDKGQQRVTAANASGINDGAAALVLASGEAVEKYGLKPMAKLIGWGQGGVDPKIMGVGPVPASRQAMTKAGVTIDDIDLVEANEAFAAQSIAGPKVLEHMVDCVLYFEGDQHTAYRILRAAKNRFGATNEIGVFEMRDSGLVEVENPSEMLLSGRPEDAPGTCVTCVMEGARPVLAEIQALAVSSPAGNPRRTSNGFDYNRFAMLLAVLEKRGGLKVSACDAYLNIIGGLSLDEPAADLAAVIALASSYLDRPVPADLVAIGEVGLTGELRSVSQLGQRVSEVRRLGFTQCLIPSRRTGELAAPAGLRLIPVRNIGEAIRAALRPSE